MVTFFGLASLSLPHTGAKKSFEIFGNEHNLRVPVLPLKIEVITSLLFLEIANSDIWTSLFDKDSKHRNELLLKTIIWMNVTAKTTNCQKNLSPFELIFAINSTDRKSDS